MFTWCSVKCWEAGQSQVSTTSKKKKKKSQGCFLEQSYILMPKARTVLMHLALHVTLGKPLCKVKFLKSKLFIILPYLIVACMDLLSLLGPLDGNIGKDSNCPSPPGPGSAEASQTLSILCRVHHTWYAIQLEPLSGERRRDPIATPTALTP